MLELILMHEVISSDFHKSKVISLLTLAIVSIVVGQITIIRELVTKNNKQLNRNEIFGITELIAGYFLLLFALPNHALGLMILTSIPFFISLTYFARTNINRRSTKHKI